MSFYVGLINNLVISAGISTSDAMRDAREYLEMPDMPDDLVEIRQATESLHNEVIWGNLNLAWIEREGEILDYNECLCDKCSHIRYQRHKAYIRLPEYIAKAKYSA